jgi:hypothetical protein
MPTTKASKKPGSAIFKCDNPTYKGDSPPIVDNDPGFDPRDYKLSDDNTKKEKFTNIIQCIIDLCDFQSDLLMVDVKTFCRQVVLENCVNCNVV